MDKYDPKKFTNAPLKPKAVSLFDKMLWLILSKALPINDYWRCFAKQCTIWNTKMAPYWYLTLQSAISNSLSEIARRIVYNYLHTLSIVPISCVGEIRAIFQISRKVQVLVVMLSTIFNDLRSTVPCSLTTKKNLKWDNHVHTYELLLKLNHWLREMVWINDEHETTEDT